MLNDSLGPEGDCFTSQIIMKMYSLRILAPCSVHSPVTSVM